MDTSYFAYDRKKRRYGKSDKKYIVINLNKNAKKFLHEIIEEVKHRYKR